MPSPVTVSPARVPARLSQKMSLNRTGLLKVGLPFGRLACRSALFWAVDRPAGAGRPLLVTAVAVVRFFMTVLLTKRTFGVSSSATPPPSWVETLFTIMLSLTFMGKLPAMMNRMPPPSSLARLAWIRFLVISTAPLPGESVLASAGSWPAIMMPPPSS